MLYVRKFFTCSPGDNSPEIGLSQLISSSRASPSEFDVVRFEFLLHAVSEFRVRVCEDQVEGIIAAPF